MNISKVPLDYQGVKIGRQNTDFVAGVSTPLGGLTLNVSGKWKEYRSQHELQNKGYETYACTVFSGFDAEEALFDFYLLNNRVGFDDVKFLRDYGFLINGRINFSDRFAAQFAEIEIGLGTYQYKANDAIRQYLIPEAMLPYTEEGYYDKSKITEEMLKLSEEFCRRFKFNWYWVEQTTAALRSTPLSGIVHYAGGDGILKPEGALNHCIMIPSEEVDYYDVDDNYSQQDKRYGKDYVFNFAGYSLTLNIPLMNVEKFLEDNDLKYVRNLNTGAFGRVLQGLLRIVDTRDRGTLMLLDDKVRENGVNITQGEWQAIIDANKSKPF